MTRPTKRVTCVTCGGLGELKGTRRTGGNCGTRRGTTRKKCYDCMGKGYNDYAVEERLVAAAEAGYFEEKPA